MCMCVWMCVCAEECARESVEKREETGMIFVRVCVRVLS